MAKKRKKDTAPAKDKRKKRHVYGAAPDAVKIFSPTDGSAVATAGFAANGYARVSGGDGQVTASLINLADNSLTYVLPAPVMTNRGLWNFPIPGPLPGGGRFILVVSTIQSTTMTNPPPAVTQTVLVTT